MHSVQFAVCSVQCAVCSVQSAVYLVVAHLVRAVVGKTGNTGPHLGRGGEEDLEVDRIF